MAAPYPHAECGTVSGYKGHIKRKEPVDLACQEANRIYTNEYRARKAGREPFVRPDSNEIPHGTPTGYRRCWEKAKATGGKTCRPCRDAWRMRRAELRGGKVREDPFDVAELEPVPAGRPACTAKGVDPEWFFALDQRDVPDWPERKLRNRNERATLRAKKVCGICALREQCLRDNLDEPLGVFGGLTRVERLRLRSTDINTLLGPLFLEPV